MLVGRSRSRAAAGLAILLALAAAPVSSAPDEGKPTRSWLDEPLAFLLRTEAEFGVDVALVLRAVGQLTGDSRAIEIAEIRRLGMRGATAERLRPLFDADLPVLSSADDSVGAIEPAPLPRRPAPAERLTSDGRRANGKNCLERAAVCDLGPGCEAWATDEEAGGLELTHQAAWLLFARWRNCPLSIDGKALQASLAGRLLGELALDPIFSETHLERVATLGQLGYGERIEPQWVSSIVAARSPQGCWGAEAGSECHPHPTALALWALAVAERSSRYDGSH